MRTRTVNQRLTVAYGQATARWSMNRFSHRASGVDTASASLAVSGGSPTSHGIALAGGGGRSFAQPGTNSVIIKSISGSASFRHAAFGL